MILLSYRRLSYRPDRRDAIAHRVISEPRDAQMEALQQASAEAYERTDTRTCHQNGSKNRSLVTRFGDISLKKPQFREKPFELSSSGSTPASRKPC